MTWSRRAFPPARALIPPASRRLLLAGLVAVLGALLPGSASAQAEKGALLIEGRGGTTTTVTLARTVDLRSPVPSELVGGGEYVAVLVERTDTTDPSAKLGAVRVRAFADGTRNASGFLGTDTRLEAGTYRVTLFGTGPVRVRYPLMDQQEAGLRVVPRTRIPVRFLGRSERLTEGLSGARIDLPGEAPAGRRVIQVGLFEGVAVEQHRMCVTTQADCQGSLPVCPPSPLPCSDRRLPPSPPLVGTGPALLLARLHDAQPTARALRWSTEGYYDSEQRLRAAAIVF